MPQSQCLNRNLLFFPQKKPGARHPWCCHLSSRGSLAPSVFLLCVWFSHWLSHGLLVTGWLHDLQPQVQTPAKKGTARKKTKRDTFSAAWCLLEKSQTLAPERASETSDLPSCGESAFDLSSPHCLEQGVKLEPPLAFPFCVCPSFLGLFCPWALPAFEEATVPVSWSPGAHSAHTHCLLGWPHTRGRWGGISESA